MNGKKLLSMLLAMTISLLTLAATITVSAEAPVTFETKVETLDQLKTIFADGGSGYLDADIIADDILTISAGKTVDLCLNGKVLDLNRKNICVYGILNVYDSADKTVHYGHFDIKGIWCYDREYYTLQEGETDYPIIGGMITNGYNDSDGGGIRVFQDGKFTLDDGSICGNYSTTYGGGIYNEGVVIVNGGLICGNYTSAFKGGGVYCTNNSEFTLNNGSISYNVASFCPGGGAYFASNSKVTMKNCSICCNSAHGSGGGVYFGYGSTVTMEDVTIAENKATTYGGGIFTEGASTITMENVKISDNWAKNYGGGIFADENSTITVGGASVIRDNQTNIDDSNIHLQNNSTTVLKLSDTNPLCNGADIGVTLWSSSGWDKGTVVDSYFGGTLTDDNCKYIVMNNSGNCNKGIVYKVKKDSTTSNYVLVGDYVVSKAELPEGVMVTDGVQSIINEDSTADMRFFWNIDFNGNDAPSKLGAYFFDWEQFNPKSPSGSYTKIENNEIDETLTDGGIFFGTITGITDVNKTYYAIPIVNNKAMASNILSGNVNDTNILVGEK